MFKENCLGFIFYIYIYIYIYKLLYIRHNSWVLNNLYIDFDIRNIQSHRWSKMSTFYQGHSGHSSGRISSIVVTRSKARESESRVIGCHAMSWHGQDDRPGRVLHVSSSSDTLPAWDPYKYIHESSPIAICGGRTICCRCIRSFVSANRDSLRSFPARIERITCAIIYRQPRLVLS